MRSRTAVRVALLAVPTLAAALVGGVPATLAVIGTLGTLAVLLMRGGRRHDALRRTRRLLLLALAVSFFGAVMTLVATTVTGHRPPRPWIGDAVALSYVPLTIAGLVLVPQGGRRHGHRARAVADGAIAATSLWYLLASYVVADAHAGAAAHAVMVAYATGDVFVISTALVVLARCIAPARGLVAWIAVGLSLVAAEDTWLSMSNSFVPDVRQRPLVQLGLLLLVGAALSPPVRSVQGDDAPTPAAWALAAVPFAPLGLCMIQTGQLILQNAAIPAAKVPAALGVAIALAGRQLAGSRDKERLVASLLSRERELEDALRIDALTGLANRLGLMERLAAVFGTGEGAPVAVALIDINDFKLINDNHGHHVGDVVIQQIGRRLAAAVRADDVAARLGGDEFAVAARAMDGHSPHQLGARLAACFREPVHADGRSFEITASIGIVRGAPPETPEQLLAHADAAMYEAKAEHRHTSAVVLLDDEGRERAVRRLRLQTDISRPDLAQFCVSYQPVIDLRSGQIRGIEALMRWRHPELGFVPPDAFIPLAEQAGTIPRLGWHVLQLALADLARLHAEAPDRQVGLGVNVSPRELADEHYAQSLLAALAEHGIAPQRVVVEITEQAFVSNLEPVVATVEELVAAGVGVAVDDFGTGYSSLRYLQQLPLGVLKLDRSYVSEVTTSSRCDRLVESVTAMGNRLDLVLVAEGIETSEQLQFLQQIGCEFGQGYLFSPPVTFDVVRDLVVNDHRYAVGTPGSVVPIPRTSTELSLQQARRG